MTMSGEEELRPEGEEGRTEEGSEMSSKASCTLFIPATVNVTLFG